MINIMYVGNAENWPDDTALHTKRVWSKNGSIVEVPEIEAPHYTQHPSVWKAVSEADMAKLRKQTEEVENALRDVEAKWGHLSSVQLQAIRAELDLEIQRRQQSELQAPRVDETQAKAANAEPIVLDPNDPATAAAAAERTGRIMQAISQLDRNNPEDWSRTPRELPRVGRVTEICGFPVSQKEVIEAVELLKAA